MMISFKWVDTRSRAATTKKCIKIATHTGLVVALLPAVLTLNLSLFHLLFTVAVGKAPH